MLTAAVAVVLALLVGTPYSMPNPAVPLLLAVAYAGYSGGLVAGFLSALIAGAYVLLDRSLPGQPGVLPDFEAVKRFGVVAGAAPLVAVLGVIAQRRVTAATEGRVRGEKAFSRSLLEGMQDGLTVIRVADRRILEINPRLSEMTGYTRDELVGAVPPFPYWPGDERAAHERSLERALAGEAIESDAVLHHRDGHRVQVIASRSPLRDSEGRLSSVVNTYKDVTERKRQERLLLESEARYRAVTDTASDAIFTIDEASTILFANRAAEKVFGHGVGEMVGRNITMLMPEAYRARHLVAMRRYLETGERHINWRTIDLPGLHRSGAEIPLEVSFGEAILEGRRVFTGIVRDMTERKQTQDALRRSQEELGQSQRMEAIGRLAGGISHDFNNLLTAITGYTDLLLADLAPGDAMRGDLEEIRRTADRASGLTRQLLAFSRRQVLEPKVLDLNRVVAEIEPLLRRIIGEDVHLVTFLEPHLRRIAADPSQLEQVILNLAVNARDSMPGGGLLTIETSNVDLPPSDQEHHHLRPGRYVMLAVSDTGTGMTAEVQAHVFEPFFTTKEMGKGTGLGLSTVYGIVAQSEGAIRVYTEPGVGTTFKIYLPDAAAPDLPRAPEPESDAIDLRGTETVLLVEDDPAVRALSRQVLTRYGYSVLEAPAPSQALIVAERHSGPIDLVLTDVVMPEMGGPELVSRLAPLRPGIGILYMSGYTEDAIVTQGVIDASAGFIQKPFSPDALARKIRAVLAARAPSVAGSPAGSRNEK